MRSLVRLAAGLSAVAVFGITLLAAAPFARHAGPPWISIEYPVNPFDASSRDAYLLVHAFHHSSPVESTVQGTAEGLVGGERKSVALRFDTTTRPGVYALRKQWSDDGVWSLLISVTQHENNTAQALVELGSNGITSVRVPTRREREWTIPRQITAQEVEQSLQSRAARTTQARR